MPSAAGVEPLSYGAALAYGVIQGVTEFLPVSSSGHLKLAHLLGLGAIPKELELPFDVLLHAATLIAIVFAFHRETLAMFRRSPRFYGLFLISMVPTGIAGLLGGSVVGWMGQSFARIGVCYLGTAMLLGLAHRASAKPAEGEVPVGEAALLESVTTRQAVMVGVLQIFALLPGVSRSGATVSAGLMGGMPPTLAVSYSFLVGLPLIGAAAAKDAIGGGFGQLIDVVGLGPIVVAFVVTLVSGLLSISALKLVVGKGKLVWFAGYCAILAIVCFVLSA